MESRCCRVHCFHSFDVFNRRDAHLSSFQHNFVVYSISERQLLFHIFVMPDDPQIGPVDFVILPDTSVDYHFLHFEESGVPHLAVLGDVKGLPRHERE